MVRPYRSSDAPAVRQIACDTADRGEPVDRIFRDRETVADVLVRGYMDYEPEHLWVAECEGRVAGYLTGCLDTRALDQWIERKVIPGAMWRAVARGALWRVQTWHLLGAFAATVLLGGFPHRIDFNRYPAHFHINLHREFRGGGLGRKLVEAFRQQADRAAVSGIHVVARGDNPGGRKFFEAMGFKLLAERPLILPQGRGFTRVSTVVLGWSREDEHENA